MLFSTPSSVPVAFLLFLFHLLLNSCYTKRSYDDVDTLCVGIRTLRYQFCCGGYLYYDPNYSFSCCNGRVCYNNSTPHKHVNERTTFLPPITTSSVDVARGKAIVATLNFAPPGDASGAMKDSNELPPPYWQLGQHKLSADEFIAKLITTTPSSSPATIDGTPTSYFCGDVDMVKIRRVTPHLQCCGDLVYDPRYFECSASIRLATSATTTTSPIINAQKNPIFKVGEELVTLKPTIIRTLLSNNNTSEAPLIFLHKIDQPTLNDDTGKKMSLSQLLQSRIPLDSLVKPLIQTASGDVNDPPPTYVVEAGKQTAEQKFQFIAPPINYDLQKGKPVIMIQPAKQQQDSTQQQLLQARFQTPEGQIIQVVPISSVVKQQPSNPTSPLTLASSVLLSQQPLQESPSVMQIQRMTTTERPAQEDYLQNLLYKQLQQLYQHQQLDPKLPTPPKETPVTFATLKCLDKSYTVNKSMIEFYRCCLTQLYDTRTDSCQRDPSPNFIAPNSLKKPSRRFPFGFGRRHPRFRQTTLRGIRFNS